MKCLVLFNNKGGVGKTTLTFNIAHTMARTGRRVVLADYDPQCNLTSVVLNEEELTDLWEVSEDQGRTVASCVDLVRRGKGEVTPPTLKVAGDNLWLLPGDLALSRFEQTLAEGWAQVHATDNERALSITAALERLARLAARRITADIVLLDVGPSLGALNRAALLAADAIVVPLAPDLFSLQGLKNIGPTLRSWRADWRRVLERSDGQADEPLPDHRCEALGYIVQQRLARADRPVAGYQHWASQIPRIFHTYVLNEPATAALPDDDPYRVARLKHLASLVPLAQAARKPLVDLKQADGVGGGQVQAVAQVRAEFRALVDELDRRLEATTTPSVGTPGLLKNPPA